MTPDEAQNATDIERGGARPHPRAYCHGYKQPGMHYHNSFDELLDCGRLGDEPHLREARASRAAEQARRSAHLGST